MGCWNSVEMVTYNFGEISEIKHKEQCGMVGYNSRGNQKYLKHKEQCGIGVKISGKYPK